MTKTGQEGRGKANLLAEHPEQRKHISVHLGKTEGLFMEVQKSHRGENTKFKANNFCMCVFVSLPLFISCEIYNFKKKTILSNPPCIFWRSGFLTLLPWLFSMPITYNPTPHPNLVFCFYPCALVTGFYFC